MRSSTFGLGRVAGERTDLMTVLEERGARRPPT
jgi:hypothetical protein